MPASPKETTPPLKKLGSVQSVPLPHPTDAAAPLPSVKAKNAGRGGLALAGGKIYFLATGLVQQVTLQSILGLSGYGALSTAQSVASISYNPLIQAGVQGVSRQVAGAADDQVPMIHRHLLKLHTIVALLAALLFLACADAISTWLGAPHLAPGLRFLSIILFLYGLYAPVVGYLNGRQQFMAQAGLDMLSATLRTIALIVGAYLATHYFSQGSKLATTSVQVQGTVLAFCVAALLWVLVAFRIAGIGKKGGNKPSTANYARIVLPILGGQILLNLLFQADALLLRKFGADAAVAAGLLPQAADRYVGAYRAAQLFCFLPFQLLSSLTFVLFPLLAQARSQNDPDEVKRLVERGLRLAVLIAALLISSLVTVPEGLLTLVFNAEAAAMGGDSMRILSVGMGFFAILGIISAALNSLGAEKQSLVLIAVATTCVGALCYGLTRGDKLGAQLLTHIALATSLGMVATTFLAAHRLKKVAGASISLLTLLRALGAVALIGFTFPRFFALGGDVTSKVATAIPTLLGAFCAVAAFVGILVITGELTREDAKQLRAVLFPR